MKSGSFSRSFTKVSKVGKPTTDNESKDPRLTLIKKLLYDPAHPSTNPQKNPLKAAKPPNSPVDLSPSGQEDIVERAFLLYKVQERTKFINEREMVYKSTWDAMERLKSIDMRLFEGALKKEEIETFPRRFSIAGEVSGGWVYDI